MDNNCRCRLQLFSRRGAKFVLLYNLLITVAFSVYILPPTYLPGYALNLASVVGVFVFPITGCLADVFCTRYRLIKISMWLIWVSVVIQSAVSVIFNVTGEIDGSSLSQGITIALLILNTLGLAGFVSNIIQFGMDQLRDAPTTEITSFIVWYIWTFNLGILCGLISRSCLCSTLKLVATLFVPACISLALGLDSIFNHWYVKEPVGQNPFRLFFGVLRYAIKNKYPHQRSAFTYWEDKPHSRIDLAKDKYGGPFTTEQVEDVKIVLRILAILTIGTCLVSLSYSLGGGYDEKVFHHLDGANRTLYSNTDQPCSNKLLRSCFQSFLIEYFMLLGLCVFVPIHEFLIYPTFKKYMLHMNSVTKFVFGLFLLVLRYISLLIIEVVGHHLTHFPEKDHMCFLSEKSQHLSLSYWWYCIPGLLQGLHNFYVFSGAIELVCSQAPSYIKGLLFGYTYFVSGLGVVLSALLLLPVSLTVENWHPVPYGCGVWFYLCVTVFFLVFTLVCIIVFKKVYKMRRRDEDLHNRHIFAINYYSHYVQYNEPADYSE